ncbi:hypothetical protein OG897_37815 [Streptomyces sp. NBC_00237]|uniref:inositol monophosphatase family protein n=1 Tax=Streptomyces sp. NBC_00237 TaxID=2975687 RepID=UPI0022554A8C|nr:inositol monophosphatase family protein [Streptomyces sp. NBC_00237]MCX5207150.1 hypothetical protein [Streptomyces sp. NBC_00237]
MWIDEVTDILREAAVEAILPRHRALSEGEITEKTPGEVVTVADREAEALITRRLRCLRDVPVVGEEATASVPALLRAVRDAPEVWLVDPLDGTPNFVAGRADYAVMAALVRGGETVAAWILQPATGVAYVAEKGSGAWRLDGPVPGGGSGAGTRRLTGSVRYDPGPTGACSPAHRYDATRSPADPFGRTGGGPARPDAAPAEGAAAQSRRGAAPPIPSPPHTDAAPGRPPHGGAGRLLRSAAPGDPAELRGAALTGFLSPAARAHVEGSASRFGALSPGTKCAGIDYPRLARGDLDFLLYHRTLPWDHAPGTLLVTEAGCVVRRPDDSSPYRPSDDRSGLLTAAEARTWQTARDLLLPPLPRKADA